MTITPPVMLDVDAVLLDIEGTTSSISFVTEVLFPFALEHLRDYLDQHWHDDSLQQAVQLIAVDAGHLDAARWYQTVGLPDDASPAQRQAVVVQEVERLMGGDVKATGLKQLQGLIWREGFESGELQAHVYDEVPAAIRRWNQLGLDVRIYSSGSIAAQKLFFGHTIAGDLLDQFRGHYDTTIGGKKDAASYRHIAGEFGIPAERIVFISDAAAEIEAAHAAGMQTVLSLRPGNPPAPNETPGSRVSNFDSLMFPHRTRDESRR